ncbi:MAG TPA: nickel-dependent hydrogenase large subunit [Egicoccus sp.]|nr:nickel-dependent hydrogenase large subunit [Egicoccus sp.]HSK22194.1 nickel-dependent hydrogenase large subunit [Egicoccus sp.]
MSHTHDRDISVEALARVEGEGALHVRVTDGQVDHVQLEIYEPPRFFEALLRGRSHLEPPDITARICGICPVAYQLSATAAIESLCGVGPRGSGAAIELPDGIRALRRLLYCGEWIESHVLHVFLLHAPDFLGYQGAIEMAADHRDLVEMALRMRKAGNTLLEVVGGRAIHPINVRVGGFHRAPDRAQLTALLDELRWGRDAAVATVRTVAGFTFPELHHEHLEVALRPEPHLAPPGATGYPLEAGRLVTSDGLDVPIESWPLHFFEEQVPHSTALHGRTTAGGTYRVGPTARFDLCGDRLPEDIRALAAEVGLVAPVTNPFRSIVVRAIETVYAFDEAVRLIEAYRRPPVPAVEVPPVAGVGHGATEAPRGLLYHRYELDGDGLIRSAVIVPPTSQNQPAIEEDLRSFVQSHLHLGDADLQWQCEQAIRNYDPCISCSTHFLDLRLERR